MMHAITVAIACLACAHGRRASSVETSWTDLSRIDGSTPSQSLATFFWAGTPPSFSSQQPDLLYPSSTSHSRAGHAWMGRGDKRTKRGKRRAKSFGVSRPRKSKSSSDSSSAPEPPAESEPMQPLATSLWALPTLSGQGLDLLSPFAMSRAGHAWMGRGDKRTKRGKRRAKSFGVSRPRKFKSSSDSSSAPEPPVESEPMQPLATSLWANALPTLSSQGSELLSPYARSRASHAWMGRGDKRTKRGKRRAQSFGVSRPRKFKSSSDSSSAPEPPVESEPMQPLATSLWANAIPTLSSQGSELLSPYARSRAGHAWMGRGDKRTKRGKRRAQSFGVSRPRKIKSSTDSVKRMEESEPMQPLATSLWANSRPSLMPSDAHLMQLRRQVLGALATIG